MKIIEEITDGATSNVFKVRKNFRTYIMKKIKPDEASQRNVKKEVEHLRKVKKLEHSVALHSHKYNKKKKKYEYLLFKYSKGYEDMYDVIFLKNHKFNHLQAMIVMREMAYGLWQIHKQGIVHRDLKPENILLDVYNLKIKYLDYGLSCNIEDNEGMKRVVGTRSYIAPETLVPQKVTRKERFEMLQKSDVWSLGILFIDICFHAYFHSSFWPGIKKEKICQISSKTKQDIIHEFEKAKINLDTYENSRYFYLILYILDPDWRTRPRIDEVVNYIDMLIEIYTETNLDN